MIEILYADAHLVVANKPAGLLSVPGRGPDKRDCLWHRVQQQFPTARIVHRLDCATSGVMVLALNADSHRALSRQFQERQTDKRYVCIVDGRVVAETGHVALPLRCDWDNRPLQMVDFAQGKAALTHWRVLERAADHTRLALTPITGRSHQLRVHMKSLGHPILGDAFYAPPRVQAVSPRLLLHAERLRLIHPGDGQPLSVESPAPF
ncbi:pseudouridine synthase [Motiliproteus sp. SC1-56]|uniref:pseudouridine synthase n=1 Tax=Motiliproteus sp. SC1-56 TaxID=2799565 RepID=UPI001A8EBC93|nr:pseudouridine synthase [Motiliproteus sp. SC1-56]